MKSAATQIVGKQSAGDQQLSAFTPGYGAPEQWLPKRYGQTGRWTDVWGLAITMVEAVIGRAPIEGDHAAMMGSAIDEQRRPTPRSEGADVDDAAEAVFQKALAVDPRHRYQEIGDFWTELHAALGMSKARPSARPARDPRREGGVARPQTERMAVSGAEAPRSAPNAAPSPPADPHAGTQPMTPAPGPSASAPTAAAAAPRVPTLIVAKKPAPAPKSSPRAGEPPRSDPSAVPAAKAPTPGARSPAPGAVPDYLFGNTLDNFDEPDDPLEPRAPVPSLERLEGVGLSPGAAQVSRVTPVRGREPDRRFLASSEAASMRAKFRVPLQLVLVGIVVMAADFAYGLFFGEPVRLGPVRPVMIAGPLVVVGLVLGMARLFGGGHE